MFTEHDFLTPEFLHLVVVAQKNIVIRGYMDEQHLRAFQSLVPPDMYNLNFPVMPESEFTDPDAFSYFIPEDDEFGKNLIIINIASETHIADFFAFAKEHPFHYILVADASALKNLPLPPTNNTVNFNKKTKTFELEFPDLTWERDVIRRCQESGDFHECLRRQLRLFFVKVKEYFAHICDGNSGEQEKVLREIPPQYHSTFVRVVQNYFGVNVSLPTQLPGGRPEPEKTDNLQTTDLSKNLKKEFELINTHPSHIVMYRLLNERTSGKALDPRNRYFEIRKGPWRQGIPREFVIDWFKQYWVDLKAQMEQMGEIIRSEKANEHVDRFYTFIGQFKIQGTFTRDELVQVTGFGVKNENTPKGSSRDFPAETGFEHRDFFPKVPSVVDSNAVDEYLARVTDFLRSVKIK